MIPAFCSVLNAEESFELYLTLNCPISGNAEVGIVPSSSARFPEGKANVLYNNISSLSLAFSESLLSTTAYNCQSCCQKHQQHPSLLPIPIVMTASHWDLYILDILRHSISPLYSRMYPLSFVCFRKPYLPTYIVFGIVVHTAIAVLCLYLLSILVT